MLETNPLFQLTMVKLREFIREPEAVFWVFVFPLLLALALGIAFRRTAPEEIPIGVQRGDGDAWIQQTLDQVEGVTAEIYSEADAKQELRTGAVALVVIPGQPWTFWYDPTRPDSRMAKLAVDDALQRGAGRVDVTVARSIELDEQGSRYIDFLLPGLLGMNLMGTGMWSIGFSIVAQRSRRLLKRLIATPMRRWQYLAAQIGGRLVFLVAEVSVLIGFARLVFGVPLRGSFAALMFTSFLGGLCFAGIGLLVAARPRSIEGVSGLMNFAMVPMWICSGVFFSTSRFPDLMQPFVQLLPLTALIDALRAVMLDGATLADQWHELAIVAVWGVVSFALARAFFRWI